MMARLASLLAAVCIALPVEANGQVTLLHEFTGGANDGAEPMADLTLSGSTLFGTTRDGGTMGSGTVFSIDVDGSNFRLLHDFGGANDGAGPWGKLTLSGSTLYGTTAGGGDSNKGTVFSINTDGTNFRLLHEFTGGVNGMGPWAGLTLGGSTLFGTTYGDREGNGDTVFSVNTDGSNFRVLHEFVGGAHDGAGPRAKLALGGSTLFGTTQKGGDSDDGTVFSIDTDGSNFRLLHEFDFSDGAWPEAGMTLRGSTLFGTTRGGGLSTYGGTVFSINTDGSAFQLLHAFAGMPDDGASPKTSLSLIGSTIFGTTQNGGDNNKGTVFSIDTDGSNLRLLHDFAETDGRRPYSGLTVSGPTLIGTTMWGGASDEGTVYSMPMCTLGLALTFESSTLTMDFLLGSHVPVMWETMNKRTGIIQLTRSEESASLGA